MPRPVTRARRRVERKNSFAPAQGKGFDLMQSGESIRSVVVS